MMCGVWGQGKSLRSTKTKKERYMKVEMVKVKRSVGDKKIGKNQDKTTIKNMDYL